MLSRPLSGELGFDPDRLFAELGERLEALAGDARVDAAQDAVRRAQLDALGLILWCYARSVHRRWADDILGFSAFSDRALVFIARERAPQRTSYWGPESDAAAADRSVRRLERMAAAAFLDELTDHCGPPPASLASLIADVQSELGWLDAFTMFLSQDLQADRDLLAIFLERPLGVTRDLRVTTAEVVTRLHQHASLLANRFQRQDALDEAGEDWAAHEREKDQRLAALPEDKAGQLSAAAEMVAAATGLPAATLLGLAALMPSQWIGTPLALACIEEQAEALQSLRRHIKQLRSPADQRSDLVAAWEEAVANGRMTGLAVELDRVGAEAADVIASDETKDAALVMMAQHKAPMACLEGLRLRYAQSAKVYADAGRLIWAADNDRGFAFLVSAARALLAQGRLFSDQEALRNALALLGELALHYRQQEMWSRTEYCAVRARACICLGMLNKTVADIEDGIALALEALQSSGPSLSRSHARELNAGLADARLALFRQLNDAKHLDAALSNLDAALAHASRDAEPAAWAALHTTNSIVSLTRARQVGAPRSQGLVERAIESCVAAASVYVRAAAPLRCAELEERAGDACLSLCAGAETEAYGAAAQRHFIVAQEMHGAEHASAAWVRLQGKIGDIDFRLARGSDRAAWVEAGLAAYATALDIASREEHAEHWASLQERLGDSSVTVTGPLEARCLDIAQAAFAAAAEVHTREANPMDWARLQTRLGHVHQRRAKGPVAVAEAKAALAAFQRAIAFFPRATEAKRWAATQHAIGTAYLTMAAGPDAVEYLEQSLAAHRHALEERSPEKDADLWLQLQLRIGGIELRLAREDGQESRGAAALAAYAAGLEVASRLGMPERQAELRRQMDNARAQLASAGARDGQLVSRS